MYKGLKNGFMRRLVCAALATAMLLCALPGFAEQGQAGYVAANQVKVYDKVGSGAKLLGTLGYGASVWVRSSYGGVAQLMNASGALGYCFLDDLTRTDPNTLKKLAYAGPEGAKVYKLPDASSAVKARVSADGRLYVVAVTPDGQWLRVKNGDAYGYVRMRDTTDTAGANYVWVVNDGCVAVIDNNGLEIGTASLGQRFELVDAGSGQWVYIRNSKGKVGRISKSALTRTDPNTLNETGYTLASGKIFWPGCGYGKTVRTLKKGTKVTVVAVTPDGYFCRVCVGGVYGYIESSLLSPTKPTGTPVLVCSFDDQDIYEDGSKNWKVIDTLGVGDEVQLLGVSNNGHHLKVRTKSGKVGYTNTRGWTKY